MPIPCRTKATVRRSTVIFALGLAAAALAACDSDSARSVGDDTRQVTVVGTGRVQESPDTLTADLGIEFTAPDATVAMNQANDRQHAVIDAVIGAGVEDADITTTQVSLQPQYAESEPTTIAGYRAANTVEVRIRQLDSASRVLAAVVETGGDATRIDSVGYSIDDDSQLVRDARDRAFNDARARAQQYAQLSGLGLGEVISISELPDATRPTPAVRAPMAADVPLEPGQQTVSFSVTAVWELG